ncbi:MAG: hypothetical protein KDA75_14280, partial [Planctomycetaceae bacterium]|nr:hypothetical protein [Planctomycetaceae bacterium]
SKPTAVHFTLIFFVMLSLFLGVFAYMYFTDFQEAQAKLGEAQTQAQSDKQAIANALQEIEEVKSRLGYNFAELGSQDDPNSVLGALQADFTNVAGLLAAAPQSQTVREMLAALAAQLKNRAEETQQARGSEQSSQQNFLTQTNQQQQAVTQAQQDQQKSEGQLRDVEATMAEQVAQLNQQVTRWQDDYRKVLGDYETQKDEFSQAREDWDKERKRLQSTIDYQREQISEIENISFESPDGEIVYVDNETRRVWINKGERDFLRPQVTFSVYTKEHRGIARSTADVKAKIEVVSVDAKSAMCRILEEDLTRPIAAGDPIYTPLWHSGLVEKIAFVGIIDLDGDGVSDRELLREMMEVNHSQIKLQIMDDGSRVPAEATLDVDTKFLVKGDIPDPNDFPGLDEKQRHIQDLMEELHQLEDEAKRYGVQVISKNEFLTWIGYVNQQRIWRPGENQPYNLGSGAQSQGVGGNFDDRTSPGTVSGAYSRERVGGGSGNRSERFGGR